MYSKTSAASRTMRKSSIGKRFRNERGRRSGVFQRDVKDDRPRVAAAIDAALDQLVEIFREDQHARVGVAVIDAAQQLVHQFIGIAFDALETLVVVANDLAVAL